jgi:hypothetical protein
VVRGGAAAKAPVAGKARSAVKPKSERDPADSTPDIEVITLDEEAPPLSDSAPDIHVVPTEELSDDLLRTLRGVVVPTVPKPRPTQNTMPYIDVGVCQKCSELIELSAHWCPHCGAERPH